MSDYLEFQKTTSDRAVYINADQILMVSFGTSKDTTTIEFVGQRVLEVRGTVEEVLLKLKNGAGEAATT